MCIKIFECVSALLCTVGFISLRYMKQSIRRLQSRTENLVATTQRTCRI